MEKANLNFKGGKNVVKSIFWIFSVLSWLLALILGWIGFVLFNKEKIIWIVQSQNYLYFPSNNIIIKNIQYYVPSQMSEEFIYIIFIVLMSLVTAGLVLYIMFATGEKNKTEDGLFNGMMDSITKFHCIPLMCASALFLIGFFYNDSQSKKELIITSVCFSFVGFVCLILICLTAKLNCPWCVNFIIKKGVFSCLIALFSYSIMNNIIKFGIVTEMIRLEKMNELEIADWILNFNNSSIMDFMKSCQIAIPISIGIINLLLSFVLKDILIVAINIIIYIGCTQSYYELDYDIRNNMYSGAEGIIDIILLVLSGICLVPLIIIYKKKLLE